MGTADRNYDDRSSRPRIMSHLTPVTKWLLIANIVIFFGDMFTGHYMDYYGKFAVRTAIFGGHVWEFITFQFLHGNVAHLMFNCIVLYFFGPIMERWWGRWKFLVFYLLCGVGGALLYSLLGILGIVELGGGIVGASAGIFGILVGIAVVAPEMRVSLLFPPIELTMRQMALALMAFAVFSIVVPIFGNEGGEAGHLGGAIIGFLLVRFPRVLSWMGRKREVDYFRPISRAKRQEPKLRPHSRVNLRGDSEIDRILDKVSSDGFASLTDEERRKLHEEHERLQRAKESEK